ncbi:MAG: hypothetical protein AAF517_11520 [Planctomycetota bacterium]
MIRWLVKLPRLAQLQAVVLGMFLATIAIVGWNGSWRHEWMKVCLSFGGTVYFLFPHDVHEWTSPRGERQEVSWTRVFGFSLALIGFLCVLFGWDSPRR